MLLSKCETKSLLKVLGRLNGLYVSAFVGGIKKKTSPTFAFETQIMEHSVFQLIKIVSQFSFLTAVKLTRKVWKEFFEKNRIVP